MKPSVGRIVHYVSFGTPGGEYGKECRAAIITETTKLVSGEPVNHIVGLCVLNPTGQFFNRSVLNDEGEPAARPAGSFCCRRDFDGGTWHWPERT